MIDDPQYFATKIDNIVRAQNGHVTAEEILSGFKNRYPKLPPAFWKDVLWMYQKLLFERFV